jgi:hypothetical protein
LYLLAPYLNLSFSAVVQLEKKDPTSVELPGGPSYSVAKRDVIDFNEHLWVHRQFMPAPSQASFAKVFWSTNKLEERNLRRLEVKTLT